MAAATGTVGFALSLTPTITAPRWYGNMGANVTNAGIAAVAGVAGEVVARGVDAATPLDRFQSHLAVAAAGLGTALVSHHIGGNAAAVATAIGGGLAVTGSVGAGLDALHGKFDRDGDGHILPDVPNGIVAGVVGALAVGVAVKYGTKAVTAAKNAKNIAAGGGAADAAGKALGELIPRSKIGLPGRMFLSGRTTGLTQEPVRTYMPHMLDGKSIDEIAELTVDSMVKQGAFTKSKIVVAPPTGTGGINPAVAIMDELMSGGNTAWVVPQYGTKPSIMSLGKIDTAVDRFMALSRAIDQRKTALFPKGDGPELYAAATSLGALTLDEAVARHAPELQKTFSKLLLLGAPERLSSFDAAKLGAGVVGKFTDVADIAKVTPKAASKMWMVDFKHANDPVGLLDFNIALKKPSFLTPAGAVDGVPMRRFTPVGTFVQHGFDVMGAINTGTGQTVRSTMHDYRGDMASAVALAFGKQGHTDTQIAKIGAEAGKRAAAEAHRVREILAGRMQA